MQNPSWTLCNSDAAPRQQFLLIWNRGKKTNNLNRWQNSVINARLNQWWQKETHWDYHWNDSITDPTDVSGLLFGTFYCPQHFQCMFKYVRWKQSCWIIEQIAMKHTQAYIDCMFNLFNSKFRKFRDIKKMTFGCFLSSTHESLWLQRRRKAACDLLWRFSCPRPPPTQPYHGLLRQETPPTPVKEKSKLPLHVHSSNQNNFPSSRWLQIRVVFTSQWTHWDPSRAQRQSFTIETLSFNDPISAQHKRPSSPHLWNAQGSVSWLTLCGLFDISN